VDSRPAKIQKVGIPNKLGEEKMPFERKRFGDRPGFGQRRDFGPREMHKAVCSECGKETEVPFKPSGDRPVYCKECFMKRRKY
jgi:CxxC-x17-CxxC domain-containing protein